MKVQEEINKDLALEISVDPQEEESMNIGELFMNSVFQQGCVAFYGEWDIIFSSSSYKLGFVG